MINNVPSTGNCMVNSLHTDSNVSLICDGIFNQQYMNINSDLMTFFFQPGQSEGPMGLGPVALNVCTALAWFRVELIIAKFDGI